jgi:nucleoside-diphosphate-sugar epimerase
MRILVIGGTSFMGPYVLRRLHALGHELLVLHRSPARVDLPADIRHLYDPDFSMGARPQLARFADEFRQFAPDVALDTIAMTEQAARTTMDVLRGVAGRIVTLSSADVYRAYGRIRGSEPGPPDPEPLREDSPLREQLYPYRQPEPSDPSDPRSWTNDYDKITVERAVQSDPALPGTVLRLPAVYGPHDGQHRLFPYLKRMDDGRPAIVLAQEMAGWRWTRGYVENVAEAIALAVTDDRAAGRTYNVGEIEAYREADWIARIAAAAGWSGSVVQVPADQLPESLQPGINTEQALTLDTSRIRQELGYVEPVTPDEALRRTVEWERANPPETIDPQQFDYAAEDAVLAEQTR